MKNFLIEVNSKKTSELENLCYGYIQIGDFHENFEMNTSFWNPKEYVNHWGKAISRLLCNEEKSCLITSLSNPQHANFIFWWPMYRHEDKVFIQNGVLFLDELSEPFIPSNPYNNIPSRETISEDGEPISEWEINIDALKDYMVSIP